MRATSPYPLGSALLSPLYISLPRHLSPALARARSLPCRGAQSPLNLKLCNDRASAVAERATRPGSTRYIQMGILPGLFLFKHSTTSYNLPSFRPSSRHGLSRSSEIYNESITSEDRCEDSHGIRDCFTYQNSFLARGREGGGQRGQRRRGEGRTGTRSDRRILATYVMFSRADPFKIFDLSPCRACVRWLSHRKKKPLSADSPYIGFPNQPSTVPFMADQLTRAGVYAFKCATSPPKAVWITGGECTADARELSSFSSIAFSGQSSMQRAPSCRAHICPRGGNESLHVVKD